MYQLPIFFLNVLKLVLLRRKEALVLTISIGSMTRSRWASCPGSLRILITTVTTMTLMTMMSWSGMSVLYRDISRKQYIASFENIRKYRDTRGYHDIFTIFFMHDISHFWSFMDQLTNAIHQFSCVFTCVSLIGSSLLLYLICHIFVMNWHHTLHFKSATFFANKYKVGHFCRKTQNTAFLSQKIST